MTDDRDAVNSLPAWTGDHDFSPSASLRVDVTPLKREPGTQRVTRLLIEELDGVARPSVDMVGQTVAVDLTLEHLGSQLTAVGSLYAQWEAPCRRCLEPIVDVIETKVQEIFERTPVEGETYPLEEDFVDLRPMVAEALALALPLSPLCRDDCPGPDPDRFSPAGSDETADEPAPKQVDDRWAALDDLVFETEGDQPD